MAIGTVVGRYPGEENLRRAHQLVYEHDLGQFRLKEDRRIIEVIGAEAYSLEESRCLKATEDPQLLSVGEVCGRDLFLVRELCPKQNFHAVDEGKH